MKIGIVLSATPTYSETFFKSKIKGLQKHGHTVILFTQSKDVKFDLCDVKLAYPIFKKNILKQILWFVFVFVKLIIHFKTVLKFISFEKKRKKSSLLTVLKNTYTNAHILTQKLDWLHFGFATMTLGKENIAKSTGAKMGVSLRGFDMAIYPVKHPHCYELLWWRVNKVHSISDDLYKLALKNGLSPKTPYQKISPAIDIAVFRKINQKVISEDMPLKIITVARLHWKKGLIDTLLALKSLKEQGIQFQYTVVGEGEEYEKLMYIRHQFRLENEVIFVGKVAHKKVRELLLQHEFYIQYSVSEGFCNAVLEAQAMGLLCIVSDAEGLSENVIDGESGWVVPKRNSQKLAKTILKISSLSEETKSTIRKFAISRVKNEFNIEKQQQEFVQFYEG